jgi:hypothetical protein
MKTTRFAVAIAVVCVACVKVSDDVKATFAPGQPSEVDNFSPRSPHSIAPPDPILTQAVLAVDASVSDASAPADSGTKPTFGQCMEQLANVQAPGIEEHCADVSGTTSVQDAGIR